MPSLVSSLYTSPYLAQVFRVSLFRKAQQLAFSVWSHTAAFAYGLFPVFGRLRGVMIVVEKDDLFLAIDRNDGLGFGFPGGFVSGKESLVDALRREIREETGLELVSYEEVFRFESDFRFPTTTVVYRGDVAGVLKGSWEGTPLWLTFSEIEAHFYPPVEPVIAYLRATRRRASY